MEQMTGIEPASQPWQGRILTVVLHLQLVTSMGFEPMNAAVKGQCVKPLHQLAKNNGAPSRTRTYDPLINSQVL